MASDTGIWDKILKARGYMAGVFSIILALGAIRVAGFGTFDDFQQRVGAVVVAAIIVLLIKPLFKLTPILRWAGLIIDCALLGCICASGFWFYLISEELWSGLYLFEPWDILMGSLGIISVLELSRRAIGFPLFFVCLIAMGYALFGNYLPSTIQHAGFEYGSLIETLWYSFDGVFGGPVSVVTSLILIFVIFGTVLEAIGTGEALLLISRKLTATTRGGPAHGAIVASGLFGTISGSTVANVVGTGVFTMPMIKKHGFPSQFAGAVEAAASTGGQIMPPIMGAVAFIMADVTGIPYVQIALAALVPSLFYYLSLFVYVSIKAGKHGLKASSDALNIVLNRNHWLLLIGFVIPLCVIIGLLLDGRSPANGGFWATLTALIIGFIVSPAFRNNPRKILTALNNAGKASAVLLTAVAAVGIIIGVMNMTGLGLKFATSVLFVAGNDLFIALLLTMIACLILGMGMPTVPAYLIIILVMGPALSKMGIPIIAAHLFAVYYGVLSVITPPVALAAFAAAPICNAKPLAIAIESCKLATVAFFIPFVFVYEPSLLLITDFSLEAFVWACIRLSLAIWLLSTAFEGWSGMDLKYGERVVRFAAAIALLTPEFYSSVAGLVLAVIVLKREIASIFGIRQAANNC